MARYIDLFFDLDRTLWDFDRNSHETLEEIFYNHKLDDRLNISFEEYSKKFREFNDKFWREHKQGTGEKTILRVGRFYESLKFYGIDDRKMAEQMSQEYLDICPYKTHLVSGAPELLESVKGRYKLHIITNGFMDIQPIKLRCSGLDKYVDHIIISEATPYRKPQVGIFKHAMEVARASSEKSLVIGDDWQKDILGAMNAKMDQAYYDPSRRLIKRNQPTYQFGTLKELQSILD